jgi:hypothetical protein
MSRGAPVAGTTVSAVCSSTCAYGIPPENDATNLDRDTRSVHLRQAYDPE